MKQGADDCQVGEVGLGGGGVGGGGWRHGELWLSRRPEVWQEEN